VARSFAYVFDIVDEDRLGTLPFIVIHSRKSRSGTIISFADP
jgi:hypothetical protein